MKQEEQSTDTLEHVTSVYCKDDKEVLIITGAIKEALWNYQWEYQEANNKGKRDLEKPLNSALSVVKEHLRLMGQYSMIDDLEDVFGTYAVCQNRTNILTQVGKHMKAYCSDVIPSKKYNDDFAKNMKVVFKEWCEKYPLDEAPASFDRNFEP